MSTTNKVYKLVPLDAGKRQIGDETFPAQRLDFDGRLIAVRCPDEETKMRIIHALSRMAGDEQFIVLSDDRIEFLRLEEVTSDG